MEDIRKYNRHFMLYALEVKPSHILFLLYLLLWFGFSTSKPAEFHQNIWGINQGHLSGSRDSPL